jgi:hypothetical protein
MKEMNRNCLLSHRYKTLASIIREWERRALAPPLPYIPIETMGWRKRIVWIKHQRRSFVYCSDVAMAAFPRGTIHALSCISRSHGDTSDVPLIPTPIFPDSDSNILFSVVGLISAIVLDMHMLATKALAERGTPILKWVVEHRYFQFYYNWCMFLLVRL